MAELCNQNVVNGETTQAIKDGLIRLGYANEFVSNSVVEDCYVSYVMIRQTGLFENVEAPYALALLTQAVQNRMRSGGDMFADSIPKSLSLGVVSMPETQCEIVVPASLLTPIKQALISLGYASNGTPLQAIQDCYFRYVIVRQIGHNPEVPFGACFLPKELRDALNPVDPEPGEDGMYLASTEEHTAIHAFMKTGTTPWSFREGLLPSASIDYSKTGESSLAVTLKNPADYNIGNGSVTLTSGKMILAITKLVGLTDEDFAKIDSGEMAAELGVPDPQNPNSPWQWTPYSAVKTVAPIIKYQDNYFLVMPTSEVGIPGSARSTAFGIDYDGTGNPDRETFQLTFGMYMENYVPPVVSVFPRVVSSAELIDFHQKLLNGEIVNPAIVVDELLPAGQFSYQNTGFNGTETAILVSYGQNYVTYDSGLEFVQLSKNFAFTLQLVGMTQLIFDQLVNDQGNVHIYTGGVGSWQLVPGEALRDIITQIPDGMGGTNFYLFLTSNAIDPTAPFSELGIKNGDEDIIGVGRVISRRGDIIYPEQFSPYASINVNYVPNQAVGGYQDIASRATVRGNFAMNIKPAPEAEPMLVQGSVLSWEFDKNFDFAFELSDLNAIFNPDLNGVHSIRFSNRTTPLDAGQPVPLYTNDATELAFSVQYETVTNSWVLNDWARDTHRNIPNGAVIRVHGDTNSLSELTLEVHVPQDGTYGRTISKKVNTNGIVDLNSYVSVDMVTILEGIRDQDLVTNVMYPATRSGVGNANVVTDLSALFGNYDGGTDLTVVGNLNATHPDVGAYRADNGYRNVGFFALKQINVGDTITFDLQSLRLPSVNGIPNDHRFTFLVRPSNLTNLDDSRLADYSGLGYEYNSPIVGGQTEIDSIGTATESVFIGTNSTVIGEGGIDINQPELGTVSHVTITRDTLTQFTVKGFDSNNDGVQTAGPVVYNLFDNTDAAAANQSPAQITHLIVSVELVTISGGAATLIDKQVFLDFNEMPVSA